MTSIDSHSSAHADAHGHDHDHPEHLAHHWDTLEQQFEANKFGMWLLLATEFLLFGGLFVAYTVYRNLHPELFQWGSQFLDTKMGAINTVILIASSLTMALGVWAAQMGRKNLLLWMLGLTFLGGCGFLVIKYFEYSHKLHNNLKWGTLLYVPADDHHGDGHGDDGHHDDGHAAAGHAGDPTHADGAFHAGDDLHLEEGEPTIVFDLDDDRMQAPATALEPAGTAPTGLGRAPELKPKIKDIFAGGHHGDHADPRTDPHRPANAHIFFGIYYCMTGLHGIHVLIGMSVMVWLFLRTLRGDFGPDNFTAVDLGGLYWHVVDLIWIFLFPLLYLIH